MNIINCYLITLLLFYKQLELYVLLVTFEVEKPIEARFFCTIWDKLPYMYKMIKKRFVGDLCHAIVLGTPLNINRSKVVIPKDKSSIFKL